MEFLFFLAKTTGVTPYVGVWIETCKLLDMLGYGSVTHYVGVWIETNIVGLLR